MIKLNQVARRIWETASTITSIDSAEKLLKDSHTLLLGIRNVVVQLILVLLLVVVTPYFIYISIIAKDKFILIEPFKVAPQLVENGYSGEIIAGRIIAKLTEIGNARINRNKFSFSQTSHSAGSFPPPTIPEDLYLDKEIETVSRKFPIKVAIKYIRNLFGKDTYVIRGEVTVSGRNVIVTVRTGDNSKELTGKIADIETLITSTSYFISENIQPTLLATYYYNKGDVKASIDTLERTAMANSQFGDADVYYLLGMIFFEKDDYSIAERAFKSAIFRRQNFSEAYYALGISIDKQGRQKEAVAMFDKAIDNNDKYADAYFYKGFVLSKMKDYDKAINCYKEAIKRNKYHRLAYINLGTAIVVKNETARSREEYLRSLDAYKTSMLVDPFEKQAYQNLMEMYKLLNDNEELERTTKTYNMLFRDNTTIPTKK